MGYNVQAAVDTEHHLIVAHEVSSKGSDFDLVKAAKIKRGAVCLNFSTFGHFADDARRKASVFIPRVGPMTVAMLLRNTVRLYENFRS